VRLGPPQVGAVAALAIEPMPAELGAVDAEAAVDEAVLVVDGTEAVENGRFDTARRAAISVQRLADAAPSADVVVDMPAAAQSSEVTVNALEPAPSPRQSTADEPDLAAASIFVQVAPSIFVQVAPTPETAGVQAAAIRSDRATITVQVVPPLAQILPTIQALIPSTGGPNAVALATGLIALGGLGVALRRVGRKRH
jgi:hypothetical protein